jgi:hypothetical protein
MTLHIKEGDGDQRPDLARKRRPPAVLGVAAAILLIIQANGGPDACLLFGVICAVAAVVIVLRMRVAAQEQQAIARRSTIPVSDDVRRQMLQEYLSRELHTGRGASNRSPRIRRSWSRGNRSTTSCISW